MERTDLHANNCRYCRKRILKGEAGGDCPGLYGKDPTSFIKEEREYRKAPGQGEPLQLDRETIGFHWVYPHRVEDYKG